MLVSISHVTCWVILAEILNEERTVSCSNMTFAGDYTFAII